MKVSPSCAPRRINSSLAQGRAVLRGCASVFSQSKVLALGVFLLGVSLAIFFFPLDQRLLETVHFLPFDRSDRARSLAWYLSTFGDYPTYNIPLALLIWVYGAVTKKSHWCRVAIICFIGASLAGLFADFFRLTAGRARPSAHLPDRFYGITYAFRGGFQSFPSGHAASVFGAAMALIVTEQPLGWLATAFALAVAWSRLELERHYPSDVIVGMLMGIYFGLLAGLGAKARWCRLAPSLDRRAGSS